MAQFDLDNPNLDGDFKELKRLQQEWKKRPEVPYKLPAPRREVGDRGGKGEPEGTKDGGAQEEQQAIIKKLTAEMLGSSGDKAPYKELFSAVEQDNVEKVKQLIGVVDGLHLSLTSPILTDPETGATVLHKAIECKAGKVCRYLIENGPQDLLKAEFTITVGSHSPKKTCLHQLTENGNLELSDLLLDHITAGEPREEYMKRTVLMEVEGQRPRHFNAIHIACLRGDTAMLQMLLDRGMDVNITNSKNDTPILWASRFNHLGTVKVLIAKGADCDLENDKGSTPLYWAVRYGLLDMVKLLIEDGHPNVNQERKLGLVTPLCLASTLGHVTIVELLLKNGARVQTAITGGRTALHLAASQGNTEILELLLDWEADLEALDDMGNTALLHASMEARLSCMAVLLQAGADAAVKNKKGQTVWDFVMEDTELLKNFVAVYKNVKRLEGRKIQFPVGKTPLHVCALKGDSRQLQLLLDLGVDKGCLDANHNTFYHLAARENKVPVLTHFLDEVDVEQKNSDGETALHLAARNGNIDALSVLLKSAKVDVCNNLGETPLHVAASSPLASPQAVAMIVNVAVNAHNWAVVDARDNAGNTALHHAAHAGRGEVMSVLSPLNPRLLNEQGESPLHVAVSQPDSDALLEAMLETFHKPEKGLDINQPRSDGETLLHIAAQRGAADQVALLIHVGADLSCQDHDGNTVLHDLVHATVDTPHNEEHVEVFKTIMENVTLWWCRREELHVPDRDTVPHRKFLARALIHLTETISNGTGLSVLQYATFLGAATILQEFFNVDHVYRFEQKDKYLYDVTNLSMETSTRGGGGSKISQVGVMSEDPQPDSDTCLDIIVDMENEVVATKMLDIHPLKEMVANLWTMYQWIYAVLMVLHIVYMSCFTAYAIPLTADSIHNDSHSPDTVTAGCFLIWPILIVLFEAYYFCYLIWNCRFHSRENLRMKENSTLQSKFTTLIYGIFDSSTTWGGILFSWCVIIWAALYILSVFEQVYILTLALIIGWIYTIAFTKAFKTVHAFSIMLKYIIVNDIGRFLFLYSFILMGFAFGMYALFQISPNIAASYPTGLHSLFTTFNMMIGMDEIFDEDTDQEYADNNSSSVYIRIVYLFYIIFSTIIMLNLLIAMMSDTYNAIQSREGQTWRVASVRMALNIEKSLPFVPKMMKCLQVTKTLTIYDESTGRWLLPVPRTSIMGTDLTDDVHLRTLHRLEGKLNHLTHLYEGISGKVEHMGEVLAEQSSLKEAITPRKKLGLRKKSMALLAQGKQS